MPEAKPSLPDPDLLAQNPPKVAHEYVEDAGMPHGYLQMEFLPAARPAIERMVKFLDARLR